MSHTHPNLPFAKWATKQRWTSFSFVLAACVILKDTSQQCEEILLPRNLTSGPVCGEPCSPPIPLLAKLATKQHRTCCFFTLAASIILNIALWGRGGSRLGGGGEVKFLGGLSVKKHLAQLLCECLVVSHRSLIILPHSIYLCCRNPIMICRNRFRNCCILQ